MGETVIEVIMNEDSFEYNINDIAPEHILGTIGVLDVIKAKLVAQIIDIENGNDNVNDGMGV